MSDIEILDILEDKVKHLVTDLQNARKMSQSTEMGTLDLTDKLSKIELKIKILISILEQDLSFDCVHIRQNIFHEM